MAPEPRSETVGRRRWLSRAAAAGALIAGLVLVLLVLFGGSGGHTYRLLFENGGQLLSGNQVLVAGQPIGSVDDVTLTDDAQAEVKVSVDRTLHEGTTAVIRAASLSGEANRYVSVTPGPDNAPALEDGATLAGEKTTSPVDLDQLFNTFRPRTRTALQNVIQGFAATYAGHFGGARRTYKYLAPSLAATRRLFTELTSDSKAFSQFLVQGSRTLRAVAARRNDLSALTSNANQALGAIASQNTALDRSLRLLPPTLKQANTTFVNLRHTLDDLTPLVVEAKPATKDLAPFLRKLRPVATRAVPVFSDLRRAIDRQGKANDLTDALRAQPEVHHRAANAIPQAIRALNKSQPVIQFARPYSPDLLAAVTKLGEVTANYDANAHYARVSSADANLFHYCSTSSDPLCTPTYALNELAPIPPALQFAPFTPFTTFTRCPGGATQPVPGSNPFLDTPPGPGLAGQCDPADVPPGP